jgi:hypothetical protein
MMFIRTTAQIGTIPTIPLIGAQIIIGTVQTQPTMIALFQITFQALY